MPDQEMVAIQSALLDVRVYQDRARVYTEAAKAPNTRKAYALDWGAFREFCEAVGRPAMPASPETVTAYIIHLAEDQGYKLSTIQRRLSSISVAHKTANVPSPTQTAQVSMVLAGLQKTYGTAQHPKKAATLEYIRQMMQQIPATRLGIRDRALLLIGFAGAFRRSELAGLQRDDIEITPDGLHVTLRRSKTDQTGQGRVKGIPYGSHRETCPVRAWQAWAEVMDADGAATGFAFRALDRHGNIKTRLSDKAVALVVKRYAAAAGLDPAQYAGHSLRSGFATTAGRAHVSERTIMKQMGHKSPIMTRKYIQEGTLFEDNAAAEIGL